ncbi:MAG TPA: hypothetical protein VMF52_01745 [Steroidobacteraceae bacterium]|nr:hypothetical protein [Steroidobacteraceae bacterium]
MRAALFFLLLAIAGCTSFANPLVTDARAAPDQRLLGRWQGQFEDDDRITLEIRANGRSVLTTSAPDEPTEKVSFRLRTATLAGLEIANLAVRDHGRKFWKLFRYELADGGELRVFSCDDNRWYDAIRSGALGGKASRDQHGYSTFVSAPSAALREFVAASRESVFDSEPLVLRRTR